MYIHVYLSEINFCFHLTSFIIPRKSKALAFIAFVVVITRGSWLLVVWVLVVLEVALGGGLQATADWSVPLTSLLSLSEYKSFELLVVLDEVLWLTLTGSCGKGATAINFTLLTSPWYLSRWIVTPSNSAIKNSWASFCSYPAICLEWFHTA